jgi:hypothetical protein
LYNLNISYTFVKTFQYLQMNQFINYLIESSICLLLFALAYRIFISKLTHFELTRIYLISSLVLSFLLPLIIIPIQFSPSFIKIVSINRTYLFVENQTNSALANNLSEENIQRNFGISWFQDVPLFIIYLAGFIYKSFQLIRNLKMIHQSIKQNPKEKEGNYWIVYIKDNIPAFSFFNYIFINIRFKNLSDRELEQIKAHECVHSNHHHTIDLLLIEIAGIFLWFNPIVYYFRKSIQLIHEYIVDKQLVINDKQKKSYAILLLKLASENRTLNLYANFTGKQIKSRIDMITKQKSSPMQKLAFLVIIPIVTLLLLSFSYVKSSQISMDKHDKVSELNLPKIGEIKWEGNKIYTTDTLNQILGLKKGDNYTYKDVYNKLTEGSVCTFYFDNGYVFYNAELFEKKQNNGSIDLTIKIYEGRRGKIGSITVKGNSKVPTEEILQKITIKPGDFFTKKEIINSIKAISAMGKFDPNKINPTPIPNLENSTIDFASVDLVFELTEKTK